MVISCVEEDTGSVFDYVGNQFSRNVDVGDAFNECCCVCDGMRAGVVEEVKNGLRMGHRGEPSQMFHKGVIAVLVKEVHSCHLKAYPVDNLDATGWSFPSGWLGSDMEGDNACVQFGENFTIFNFGVVHV